MIHPRAVRCRHPQYGIKRPVPSPRPEGRGEYQTKNYTEEYRVDLDGVTALELSVIPDISGGDARASLKQLRLACRENGRLA